LQLHNEYVDLKPDHAVKKGMMMARLLADNFERLNGMIIPQRRRGALPKVVQGGGLRLVHVSPICKLSKTAGVITHPFGARTSSSCEQQNNPAARVTRYCINP
jgi:hypothetical protein